MHPTGMCLTAAIFTFSFLFSYCQKWTEMDEKLMGKGPKSYCKETKNKIKMNDCLKNYDKTALKKDLIHLVVGDLNKIKNC